MSLETILIEILVPILKSNFYIFSLIGSIISNNLFVIFLSSLAGQGIFPLWKVWIIALLGMFISDTIWFNIGKSQKITSIIRHRHFLYNYYSIKKLIEKSHKKNNFIVFLGSKFVYGTKILTLMYAGRRNMKLTDFIKYNFTASTIWVTILVFIGFLAGKGFTQLFEIFNNLKQTLIVFTLIVILIYILWFISGKLITNSWRRIGDKMIVPKFRYKKFMNRFS